MVIEELRKLVEKSEQEIKWAERDNQQYREEISKNEEVALHHFNLIHELEDLIETLEEDQVGET